MTISRDNPAADATRPMIPFDNSYTRLPATFFARLVPTPVAAPVLIAFNRPLAVELGLDADALERDGASIFSGNSILPGSDPIAMAYSGHQFGSFNPQLGDGRAILLGEVIDGHGARRDIQLKGSGPTPYSRRGDGRAALGPVLREYIVSEAMHALGVSTTRALAAVTTGEPVWREAGPTPGGIVTRVAASHIRVGTFQCLAARGDADGLKALTDHAIARHFPDAGIAERPALAFVEAVMERQAALIAQWMCIGFIHGVMNTDNMAISGETIDFGPCALLDAYDPGKVFSSIDRGGRYAYGNQPAIGQWNIARLAEALLPLIDPDEDIAVALATEMLGRYGPRFQTEWLARMRAKLGLSRAEEDDLGLVQAFLSLMHEGEADFTLSFRALCAAAESGTSDRALVAHFSNDVAIAAWLLRWRQRLQSEGRAPHAIAAAMRDANPIYIPRNHRIEQAIAAAVENGDLAPFHALCTVLAHPYRDQPEFAPLAEPPLPAERVLRTFCGT